MSTELGAFRRAQKLKHSISLYSRKLIILLRGRVLYKSLERERDRVRDTHIEEGERGRRGRRENERETDRQAETQTDRQTETQRDTHRETHREKRETRRHTETETERLRQRQN